MLFTGGADWKTLLSGKKLETYIALVYISICFDVYVRICVRMCVCACNMRSLRVFRLLNACLMYVMEPIY
jgi:hypothetical protein